MIASTRPAIELHYLQHFGSEVSGRPLVVSATNIHGLGATQLVRSLLPALMHATMVEEVWEPPHRALSNGIARRPEASGVAWRVYIRRLPNVVSRVVECLLLGGRIARGRDLLVLGDLPYRVSGRQVVLVHTPFLLANSHGISSLTNLKSKISRGLFRINMHRVHQVVVQTETMRDGMLRTYPKLTGRIAIVSQPAPPWLLATQNHIPRQRAVGQPLRLFFPASPYPHKNHALLAQTLAISTEVGVLDLTIPPEMFPGADARAVCHGTLDTEAMIRRYRACDALVMPSLEESYGLPLVEAMTLGLPILAADRPYAHALCGDGAIYFDPQSPVSLADAVKQLRQRLDMGWKPDWKIQLSNVPQDWDDVARRMLALFDT